MRKIEEYFEAVKNADRSSTLVAIKNDAAKDYKKLDSRNSLIRTAGLLLVTFSGVAMVFDLTAFVVLWATSSISLLSFIVISGKKIQKYKDLDKEITSKMEKIESQANTKKQANQEEQTVSVEKPTSIKRQKEEEMGQE